MKFLTIFFDMVRPNLLNIFSPWITESSFDLMLKKIGGTLYTNCYTPGPDTPRSMSCFWSGRPIWENGCNTRLKYPGYYMISPSFLDLLKVRNYDFNFFLMPWRRDMGILPKGYGQPGNYKDNENVNLEKFLSECIISDNSFTFFDLPNFHWTIDDFLATKHGVKEGLRINGDCLEIIDNRLGFHNFDYVFIFSDHGCKLHTQLSMEANYKMMNADRTQVLMLLKQKGESELIYNDKLCSILDVYPTICDILNMPYNEDHGFSLLSSSSHDYLISEDSGSTSLSIYQSISLWVLIKTKGMYFRDMSGEYFYENESAFDMLPGQIDEQIAKKSFHFKEYLVYKEMHTKLLNTRYAKEKYTNGQPRKINPYFYIYLKFTVLITNFPVKIINRFKRLLMLK